MVVTMTSDGPKIANLMLNGILDKHGPVEGDRHHRVRDVPAQVEPTDDGLRRAALRHENRSEAASMLTMAALAVLGIPLWMIVAALALSYWSRRRFKAGTGVFPLPRTGHSRLRRDGTLGP